MIFIRYPFPCNQQILDFGNTLLSANVLKERVESYLKYKDFSLLHNGRKLQDMDVIPENSTIHVSFSLPGGKGGFGSMLRAIGAQIEKTTNREACRDLSGRRLRDINEEQRLKKWISKEAEREAEKIKRRQARIERLKTKAPHNFFDFEYEKEISQLPDRINDALSEGLQKAKNPKKRPFEKSETKVPKKSWLSDDLPLTSSDSDSDDTAHANPAVESNPKKLKTESNNSTSNDSDVSESFQPQPCSSKDCIMEDSFSNDTNSTFAEAKSDENSNDSNKEDTQQELRNCNKDESNRDSSENESNPVRKNEEVCNIEISSKPKETEKSGDVLIPQSTSVKQSEEDTPIDLMEFKCISDLEALGLDRLKSALISRGLKCGGTLSDRAQRLWKVRGLQPQEYPANLLVKSKK